MALSALFWLAAAALLFWAVGAYNRLVRLRAGVAQAFAGIAAHGARLLALLEEFGAANPVREAMPAHAVLKAAAAQFAICLAAARAAPLHAAEIAALATAAQVLGTAWGAALHELPEAEGKDAPAAAATGPRALWRQRWEEEQMQSSASVQQFHTAVQHYNAAIAQFPALLLAWLFGFKAARALEWHLSQGKP